MNETGVAGAVLLCFFAALAGAIAPRPAQPIGAPRQEQGGEQPAQPDSDTVVDERASRSIEQVCQQGADDPVYADLCQQWRMANAAERQVRWTVIEVVGLLLVLGASVVSARAAIRAATASEDSAKAAIHTADTERKALAAQYRPWLSRHETAIPTFLAPEDRPSFTLRLVWRNTGHSAALNVGTYARFALIDPDTPIPTFTPEFGDRPVHIAPQTGISHSPPRLSHDEFLDVIHRRKWCILYRAVRYEDRFSGNEIHFTEITERMQPNCDPEIFLQGLARLKVDKIATAMPAEALSFWNVGEQHTMT